MHLIAPEFGQEPLGFSALKNPNLHIPSSGYTYKTSADDNYKECKSKPGHGGRRAGARDAALA